MRAGRPIKEVERFQLDFREVCQCVHKLYLPPEMICIVTLVGNSNISQKKKRKKKEVKGEGSERRGGGGRRGEIGIYQLI